MSLMFAIRFDESGTMISLSESTASSVLLASRLESETYYLRGRRIPRDGLTSFSSRRIRGRFLLDEQVAFGPSLTVSSSPQISNQVAASFLILGKIPLTPFRPLHHHLTTQPSRAAAKSLFFEHPSHVSMIAARDDITSRATASLREKFPVAEQSDTGGIKPLTARREKTPRMWAGIGFQSRTRQSRRCGSNRGGGQSFFEAPPRFGTFMEGCGSSEEQGGPS